MDNLKLIPYTAISISIVARFIFMYLLYTNKSKNTYSLIFCILNISSSSMWIYYSAMMNDSPLIFRSSTEVALLTLSCGYIIINKIRALEQKPEFVNIC